MSISNQNGPQANQGARRRVALRRAAALTLAIGAIAPTAIATVAPSNALAFKVCMGSDGECTNPNHNEFQVAPRAAR